jgi:hypothetical protein
MAWPKDLSRVICVGFPESYLPALRNAISNKEIKWVGKQTLFIETCEAEFKWADAVWELVEHYELVNSIRLISGRPNHQDLSAAVLLASILDLC